MKESIYLGILYDYYGMLLTEKQREYFENYHFSNLTLTEISENKKVSRNAVHKQIKDVEEKLLFYEKNLNLYEKAQKIEEIIKDFPKEKKEEIMKLI